MRGTRPRAGARRAEAPGGAGQDSVVPRRPPPAPPDLQGRNDSRREADGRGGQLNHASSIHRSVVSLQSPIAGARGCVRSTATAAPAPQRAGGAQPTATPRVADRGTLDGPDHRLRRHAHRGHQSGHRRRDRRAAARDPHRRQGAGHHQPDRVGRQRSAMQYDLVVEQPITALEQQLHQLFPGETIQVAVNADAIVLSGRVSSTEVMLRAAEVARAVGAEGERHQHAAGARRRRLAAGDAAGALRRGQPPRPHRARRRRSSPAPPASRTGRAAPRRSSSRRRTSTPTKGLVFTRLPEPVPLQHQVQRRHADQGAASRPATSRAWPSRT